MIRFAFRKYLFLLLIISSLWSGLYASPTRVRIGLFYEWLVFSAVVTPEQGEWIMVADSFAYPVQGMLYVSLVGDRVLLRGENGMKRICGKLFLRPADSSGVIAIRPLHIPTGKRQYRGILEIIPEPTGLKLILDTSLEEYLAGVVYTEGGETTRIEFYKAQAVLCRTYTFRHFDKHGSEGFNLCDAVHCQAFLGTPPSGHPVYRSVTETRGLVVTDRNGELITTAFHSNCGGQTADGHNVWIGDMPYLRPVKDTFCLYGRNARWTRSLPLSDWKNYLKEQGIPEEMLHSNAGLEFFQPERTDYYRLGDYTIPLARIREDWGLKSSFFDIVIDQVDQDRVILKGRGYGHGAGMCQEGALKMSELGYTFYDMIHYYFHGVTIQEYAGKEEIP